MKNSAASYRVLYMVDISSFIFRAYYAIREMTAPDGTPVNAVYGVASMLGKLIDEVNPEHLVVVYDSKEPSFRKQMYEEYKANRSAPPETLLPQFDLIEEMISYMGIHSFRKSGVEADDLIATLNKQWVNEGKKNGNKNRVVIVTGDKDLMALVSADTQLWDTMKEQHFTEHEVIEKFGVKPSQIRDYLAIVGDSSDNIPGITGIGPKGAEVLLKEYGTLEAIIEAAKQGKIKGKKCEVIAESEKAAKLSQELATLHDNIEINFSEDALSYQPQVKSELLKFFEKYNLKSLYARYASRQKVEQLPSTDEFSFDADENTSATKKSAPKAAPAASVVPTAPMASASDFDTPAAVRPGFTTISDLASLKTLVSEIEKTGLIAFDTETTSLDPRHAKLVGMAISTGAENGYYIPVGHEMRLDSPVHQLTQEEAFELLKPVLESPKILKVGQNLKYDYRVMHNQGVCMQGIHGDTMISAHLVDSSGRHNLDDLSQKYLHYKTIAYEEVAGKGVNQVTFDQVSIEAATNYSAEDAWCTMMLWKILEPRLITQGAEPLFRDVDLPMVEVVSRMEEAGIKVDVPFLQKLDQQFEKELHEIEKKVRAFSANVTLNLNSPKQLAVFLFEELKLPAQGKTKTGYSTDASVLEALASMHEAPKLLLEHREISKLRGTYVQPLQTLRDAKDSRVRTNFNLTGAATGRLSSSDPNLQNIPTRSKRGQLIREAFIAENGNVLLSADYSQVELRILAHLSGDQNLIDSFVKDEDVHRRTASEIFHVKPEEVTDEQRAGAKAINFGLMYGKGPFALAEELHITRTEAKRMIDQYFTRYSRVKEFLDGQIQLAHEQGFVSTLLGRKRMLPEINSKNHMMKANAERMAMNSPIQGTASDLIKTAMVKLDRVLSEKKLASKMLLQVHDELIFECPENEIEEMKSLVESAMSGAYQMKVPLKVNLATGKNWAEL
jgi:DNA polymerase-1